MGLLDLFRRQTPAQADIKLPDPALPNVEQKASAVGSLIAAYHLNRPVWSDVDYYSLTRASYVLNPIAFRCVKMIATASATVPLMLKGKGAKEIETHPILDLLNHPSPLLGQAQFFEAVYSYLLLSGNSYIEAVGPDGRAPMELWTPRPDRIKVVAGETGLPAGYEYNVNGRRLTWAVDQITGRSNILHIAEFNPVNDWYGMSRVQAALKGIDRNNAYADHNKALLDNGARPSGAMIFEPLADGSGGFQSAPDQIIEDAEARLTDRHSGPANAGRPMVISGKVKWESMGLSPVDMDFENGKEDAARDICVALGVPHLLIVQGSATFNNIREAKAELYEETILPLVNTVMSSLNIWLPPRFGDGLYLEPDLDAIPALELRRESKRKSTTDLLDKGVISSDEAREALQYGPRPANAVEKVEPQVISALLGVVQTVGLQPLIRYMKSVNLFEADATEETIINAALALIADDQDEADDPEDPEDPEDQGNEDPAEDGGDDEDTPPKNGAGNAPA